MIKRVDRIGFVEKMMVAQNVQTSCGHLLRKWDR